MSPLQEPLEYHGPVGQQVQTSGSTGDEAASSPEARTQPWVPTTRVSLRLTEAVEVLAGGGEGVVLVQGADLGGALICCGDGAHLPLLGGAAGRLLLLLCQFPTVALREEVDNVYGRRAAQTRLQACENPRADARDSDSGAGTNRLNDLW